MNDAKIGDAPWGCLIAFAIVGIVAAVALLIYALVWAYKHIHFQ